jgi:pyrroline-5-carboxylate reductase
VKVLFVGGGNMCQAILGGLIAQGVPMTGMRAIEPQAEARAALRTIGVASTSEFQAADLNVDTIVLAVKPQMMRTAVAPLAGKLRAHLVISIAAGIRSVDLARWLAADAQSANQKPYENIVRAMPNTPALIRAGITGLYAAKAVGEDARTATEALLGAVGETAWFDDEGMLDAVTAERAGVCFLFHRSTRCRCTRAGF